MASATRRLIRSFATDQKLHEVLRVDVAVGVRVTGQTSGGIRKGIAGNARLKATEVFLIDIVIAVEIGKCDHIEIDLNALRRVRGGRVADVNGCDMMSTGQAARVVGDR